MGILTDSRITSGDAKSSWPTQQNTMEAALIEYLGATDGASFTGRQVVRTSDFTGARAYKSGSGQSLASLETWYGLQFDAETFDTDTFHDNVTNNHRFTIPSGKDGKYLVTLSGLAVFASTGGFIDVGIGVNAVAGTYGRNLIPVSNVSYGGYYVASFNITVLLSLSAADYVCGAIELHNTATPGTCDYGVHQALEIHRVTPA